MDLGPLGSIHFDLAFLYSLLSIILIDLILSGDNAVIIAMAVRPLPPEKRKTGIVLGAGAAVLLRIVFTFFIAQMLSIAYLKLVGGLLILWIAVKLFIEGAPGREQEKEAATVFQAMKLIITADVTMSLDNMLAVGGASHGNLFLLLFGLGLSIPLIIFTSGLLSMLMDRYPIIIYIGAAILGRVGAEMMMTDPAVTRMLHLPPLVVYGVELFCAVGVIALGQILLRRLIRAEAKSKDSDPDTQSERKAKE